MNSGEGETMAYSRVTRVTGVIDPSCSRWVDSSKELDCVE